MPRGRVHGSGLTHAWGSVAYADMGTHGRWSSAHVPLSVALRAVIPDQGFYFMLLELLVRAKAWLPAIQVFNQAHSSGLEPFHNCEPHHLPEPQSQNWNPSALNPKSQALNPKPELRVFGAGPMSFVAGVARGGASSQE